MDSDSDVEKIISYVVQKRRRKREYIRNILRGRANRGETFLYKEMQNDPEYHTRYFRCILKFQFHYYFTLKLKNTSFVCYRMEKNTFELLLSKVGPKITHGATHSYPISTTQRLAVTLR